MVSDCFDVAIVGGGASGLTAAIFAARSGCRVLLFEQKEALGKKIYATGNGKCNFTNRHFFNDCFRGTDLSIAKKVLASFSLSDTLTFFHEIGILPTERDGYFYPNSEQASSVAEALIREVRCCHVTVRTETKVLSITKRQDSLFLTRTEDGTFLSKSILLSTGGKASPVHGSDGSGYLLAKEFGHTISPVVPAIVQLKAEGDFFKTIAGVRLPGKITLLVENQSYIEKGELLMTAYGLSGIPVLQVSRYAALALEQGKQVTALLDFLPDISEAEVYEELKQRYHRFPEESLCNALLGLCHQKINYILLKKCDLMPEKKRVVLSDAILHKLALLYKEFPVQVTGTNGFLNAQACAGGVLLSEVTETLQSKLVPGLFFAGELLDVDGTCGGYNLQWAWSSGAVAAKEIGGKYASN